MEKSIKGEVMFVLENEKVKIIRKGKVAYLQFNKLLEYQDKIVHAYTLKENGASYESNDGTNYRQLCDALEIDDKKLISIKEQIHSQFVECVEDEKKVYTKIDGLITNKKEIALSLRFADCTPLFLYDPIHNVIGNIHSGWKGTTKKIAREAVKKMKEVYNTNPKELICCIGPCIRKCHFEVQDDVKEIFEQVFKESKLWEVAIEKGKFIDGKQKYTIDTTLLNKEMLLQEGLKEENIIDSGICTVCHSDKFHSYRVEREKAGRNTAIIGLKK